MVVELTVDVPQLGGEVDLLQVAFAANRVDMWWDGNDTVTVVRCWKYL